MTRYGAIDCGTNSIRLLISDVREVDGVLEFTEIHRLMEIIRLGQGVDANGRLTDGALERLSGALTAFADVMQRESVEFVRMVATSAVRDVPNRDEYMAITERALTPWGARAEVITGEEEARLSFRGAVDDLLPEEGPFAVIDIGGGSTEVIVGDHDGNIDGSISVPLGCVRMTERYFLDSPPSPNQIANARAFAGDHLAMIRNEVPVEKAKTVVGCAGTFTTLSAIAQGLETYDPHMIHLSTLRFDGTRTLNEALIAMSSTELAANPAMHPGRADVFAAGLVVVDVMMDLFEGAEEFRISEQDILDGIVGGLVDTHGKTI